MDVAKGAALLVIIISHANGINFFLIAPVIPTFMMISGYFYRPGRGYGESVKRRAKRLLIPYFGYSALLWVFYAVIRRNLDEMLFSLFGIFYSKFCIYNPLTHEEPVELLNIANGAMWYLTAFFAVCLVFHLIVDKCLASWKITAFWVVILLAVSMLLSELPVLLPWSIDMAGMLTIFMIAGAWMRKTGFFEKKEKWWMVAGALLFYVIVGTFNGYQNSSVRNYGQFGWLSAPIYAAISLCAAMLYVWVSKWIQNTKLGDLLAYVGVHSMELLCIHMVVLEVFEIVAERFVDVSAFSGIVRACYVIVRVGTAVLVSLIVGRIVGYAKEKLFAGRNG